MQNNRMNKIFSTESGKKKYINLLEGLIINLQQFKIIPSTGDNIWGTLIN